MHYQIYVALLREAIQNSIQSIIYQLSTAGEVNTIITITIAIILREVAIYAAHTTLATLTARHISDQSTRAHPGFNAQKFVVIAAQSAVNPYFHIEK